MPLYSYECKSCEHLFEESFRIDDRKVPTENPCSECGGEVVQVITGMNIGDAVRLGIKKPSGEWNHMLSQIAEQNPRSKLHEKLSQGRRKKGL